MANFAAVFNLFFLWTFNCYSTEGLLNVYIDLLKKVGVALEKVRARDNWMTVQPRFRPYQRSIPWGLCWWNLWTSGSLAPMQVGQGPEPPAPAPLSHRATRRSREPRRHDRTSGTPYACCGACPDGTKRFECVSKSPSQLTIWLAD